MAIKLIPILSVETLAIKAGYDKSPLIGTNTVSDRIIGSTVEVFFTVL